MMIGISRPSPLLLVCAVIGLTVLFDPNTGLAKPDQNHFRHLEWEGQAYFSKSTKRFTHCAMTAVYETGTILGFGIRKSGLVLILGHPDWDLESNTTYNIVLSVDNRWTKKTKAYSRGDKGKGPSETTDSVHIYLGHSRDAFESLKHGRVLRVETPRKVLRYKLTGTLVALRKLRDCYARQNRLRQDFASSRITNPFAIEDKSASRRTDPFSKRASIPNSRRPTPKQSDRGPSIGSSINRAAQWVSQVSDITSEIYEVIGTINEAEKVGDAFIENQVSQKYAEKRTVELLYQAQAKLKSIKQSIREIPEPPKFPGEPNFGRDMKRHVNQLNEHTYRVLAEAKAGILAALDGDTKAHSARTANQFSNYVLILKTENIRIDLSNTTIPKDSPQLYLNQAIKFGNVALIEIFSVFRDVIASNNLNASPDFAENSARALRNAVNAVEDGRAATIRFRKLSKVHRDSLSRQLETLITTLDQSFDIEEKIAEIIWIMTKDLDDLLNAGSDSDPDALTKRWQITELELQRYSDQRVKLINNRLKLVAEMDFQ